MAYPYYAPFYRPTYNEQGQNPNMAQFNQLFQQPMAQQMQPVQTAQQPTNDFLWVLGQTEAEGYPVAPNNTVTLWDKNNPTIYIKSANAQGVPSIRILDFVERASNGSKTPAEHACKCGDNFVTKEQFKALEGKFDEIKGIVDGIKAKPLRLTNGKDEE